MSERACQVCVCVWGGAPGAPPTMLSFAVSLAKNWGHLGPPETKSELIFGPNLMIFWHLE